MALARLRMASSSAIVFVDQCLVSGSNFVITIMLARYLGVEIFGLFSLFYLLVLFAFSIQLALIVYPMQALAKSSDCQERYIRSITSIQLLFSMGAGLVAFVIGSVWGGGDGWERNWVFSSVFSIFLFIVLNCEFVRRIAFLREEYTSGLVLDLVVNSSRVLLIVLVSIYSNADLTLVFLVYLITAGFGFYFWGKRYFSTYSFELNKKDLLENWKFSKWLLGSAFVQWFSGNAVILAAGGVMGVSTVGVIKACQNLLGPMHVALLAMDAYLVQKFKGYLTNDGFQVLKREFIIALSISLGFVGLMVVMVWLGAELLLKIFYGAEYVEYSNFLVIVSLLYFFIVTNLLLKILLRTLGKTRYIFIADALGALVASISAYSLVELYGLDGVVIAMLAPMLAGMVILLFGVKEGSK